MISENINILLADDDKANCLLFKEALEELPVSAILNIVYTGEQLIEAITDKEGMFPDVLFLDLNLPCKNGFATLGEIKRSTKLQKLPVIIFSSASDEELVNNDFRDATYNYICKPADFSQLKKVNHEALTLITQKNNPPQLSENFMITDNSIIIPDKK